MELDAVVITWGSLAAGHARARLLPRVGSALRLPVCARLQREANSPAHVATSSVVMKRIILD